MKKTNFGAIVLLAVITFGSASCQKTLDSLAANPATFMGYGNDVFNPQMVRPGTHAYAVGFVFQSPVAVANGEPQRFDNTPLVNAPPRMTVVIYETNGIKVRPMTYSVEVLTPPSLGWYNHYIANQSWNFQRGTWNYLRPMRVNLAFSWHGYPATGYTPHYSIIGHL